MKPTISIGKIIKPGFLKKGCKGKFLKGTIKGFGYKKGVVNKIMRK